MSTTPFHIDHGPSESDIEQLTIADSEELRQDEHFASSTPVFRRRTRKYWLLLSWGVIVVFVICLFYLLSVDIPMLQPQTRVSVQDKKVEHICLHYEEQAWQSVLTTQCENSGDMITCIADIPKDHCHAAFLSHQSMLNRTYNSLQQESHMQNIMLDEPYFQRNMDFEADKLAPLPTQGQLHEESSTKPSTSDDGVEKNFEAFVKDAMNSRVQPCNSQGCCPNYHSCKEQCLKNEADVLLENTLMQEDTLVRSGVYNNIPHPAVWLVEALSQQAKKQQFPARVKSFLALQKPVSISFNSNWSFSIGLKGKYLLKSFTSTCLGSLRRVSIQSLVENSAIQKQKEGFVIGEEYLVIDYSNGLLYKEYLVRDTTETMRVLVPIWRTNVVRKEKCLDSVQLCSRLCSVRIDALVARTQYDAGYKHCYLSKHTFPVTDVQHNIVTIAGAPGLSCHEVCSLTPVLNTCDNPHIPITRAWKELAFSVLPTNTILQNNTQSLYNPPNTSPLNYICKDAYLSLVNTCPLLQSVYNCPSCSPAHALEQPGYIAKNPSSDWGSISSKKFPLQPNTCHTNTQDIYSCSMKQLRISRLCTCLPK